MRVKVFAPPRIWTLVIGLGRVLGSMIALAAVAGCAPARSELKPALSAADSGTVWFASEDVVLSADLKLPAGSGPFPAVVLMHGCGGVVNTERGWTEALRPAGYATFVSTASAAVA